MAKPKATWSSPNPKTAACMQFPRILLITAALAAIALPKPAGELDGILNRIDKTGAAFRSMSAKVKRLSHTAVINEDNVDSGTMLLKRPKPRDMRMLVDLTQPDPKTVAFQGRKVEIYYPKIQTVQEFDVGKNRELVDQLFLIGFGTSRADLETSYQMRALGPDTIQDQKTERLELIPKSKEVLNHLKRLELWISETGYPVQQKIYLPGGDYMVVTYSDVKINPDLPDADLKLHLPKNVKREFPQK
ncbi:MAG: outer membrane lipoprotein carrier protein LolA [Bryobacteraceae bacterium]